MIKKFVLTLGCLLIWPLHGLEAAGRTEAGLLLLESPGARIASLGEAFSAVPDDVTALSYNPASLSSLTSNNVSLTYQKGLVDDAFGHMSYGAPLSHGTLGLMVSYYDGGEVEVFDGSKFQNVTSQTDMLLGVGYSRAIKKISLGGSAKYLSSEIAETTKASALMADLGLTYAVFSSLSLGAAVQNIGSSLKYENRSNDLPRIARAGLAYRLISNDISTVFGNGIYQWMLVFDGIYHFNTADVDPAVGLEVQWGPMALRGGMNQSSDLHHFSFGAGFNLGRTTLDYSFGMVDDLDSTHRVSLGFSFGSKPDQQVSPMNPADFFTGSLRL